MKLTGAQIILRKLIKHNIKVVFEFPGGSICPILDELYKYKKIKTQCFRHEQAAIHAADAYARLNKAPSVCMATSGPGASNLVTGIANAFMDSVPIVVITGQVAVWDLKKGRAVRQRGFQELDIVSVVKSITKAAFLVNDVSKLSSVMDEAFFIAKEGRPGPVLIDVPINVQYTPGECNNKERSFKNKKKKCQNSVIRALVKRFCSAQRPLILAGGGITLSSAQSELMNLLKKYHLPVAETLMGLTNVPYNYDLNLGLVGYAGNRISNLAVKEANFILGLGLRFDNRAFPDADKAFSKSAYIVHVDCDANEFNHRIIADKTVLSDAKLFLQDFIRELAKADYRLKGKWLQKLGQLKEEFAICSQENKGESKINPRYIISRLSEMLDGKNAIITTDVGQHQLWTAQHFKFRNPNSLITSGGLGTMGFGLPAAIGAQLAEPQAQVFNITSDGSFQMNIQELATIKDYGLPVKIILLNNKCLGLVRQIQEFAFCKRYASTRLNSAVNFVQVARAYGIEAFAVKSPQDVIPALKRIVSGKKSILVEFRIDELENVYPVRIKGKVIYSRAES